jgi:hypothetical protein
MPAHAGKVPAYPPVDALRQRIGAAARRHQSVRGAVTKGFVVWRRSQATNPRKSPANASHFNSARTGKSGRGLRATITGR